MSAPDDERWVDDLAAELRAEVPVRPEWRARLLDEVAREPRLVATPGAANSAERGARDDVAEPSVIPIGADPRGVPRAIAMRPLVGVAAALLFMALGAGGTLAVLELRGGSAGGSASVAAAPSANGGRHVATTPSNASAGADVPERGLVRFALSAPQASRVALVGSFNEWNPVATPLVRDARTGAWTVTLRLPPGRHVYAFVVDGDVTADPAAPRAADDDFGSPNSVVLVSGPAS